MDGSELAKQIQRDLVQSVLRRLQLGFGHQIPDSTPNEQAATIGEAEVRFAIRDAAARADGLPRDYLVLREAREASRPGRPWKYWYGIVHVRADGHEFYEAFHGHAHPDGPFEDHYHLKVNNRTVERRLMSPTHVETALIELMGRYWERVEEDEANQ